MIPKTKKAPGNSKRKCKLKSCDAYKPRGEMIITSKGAWCSIDHQVEWGLLIVDKLRVQRPLDEAKRQRILDRAKRVELMSLTDWVNKTQAEVNMMVRLLDAHLGCISCPQPVDDCGHYFHKGTKYRTSWLTLFLLNLNGQCRHCNSFKGGGNQHDYRIGFILRHGAERFEQLQEFKRRVDRREIPELTIEDCQRILAEVRPEIRRLKKGLPPSRDWRNINIDEFYKPPTGEKQNESL